LRLSGTKVTADGRKRLRQALPGARVSPRDRRGPPRFLAPSIILGAMAIVAAIVVWARRKRCARLAPSQRRPRPPVMVAAEEVPAPTGRALPPPRSRTSMKLLRGALVPVLLGLLGALALLVAGAVRANTLMLGLGLGLLAVCTALIVGIAYLALYVQVIEGSRGLPRPQPIDAPTSSSGGGVPAAELAELQFGPDGLASLGFVPAGWFYLDNFTQLRVGAWRHCSRPEVAYVMFQPGGRARLRLIRNFGSGAMLVTSNRLLDLAPPTPASVYVQVLWGATAADLWSWHLEAEALFEQEAPAAPPADDRITRPAWDYAAERGWPSPGATLPEEGEGAMGLYMELVVRWSWAVRGRRLWLLHASLFRECARMYLLSGLSVERQIAAGWAVPPSLRHHLCLPEGPEEEGA
jgi:hypothetical protein